MKLLTRLTAAAAGAAGLCCLPAVAALTGLGGTSTGASSALTASGPASALAVQQIPPPLLAAYQAATVDECPPLPWQLLAAIGWVESRDGDGHVDPRTGEVLPPIVGPALDGRSGLALILDPQSPDGFAHAIGPMQFLSTTWDRYGIVAPWRRAGATPDPNNAFDAVVTAARMLCADGAATGHLQEAVLSYNHSTSYLQTVWATAVAYGMAADGTPATAPTPNSPGIGAGSSGSAPIAGVPGGLVPGDATVVIAFAETQLGVPYQWGGSTPGKGLDCSGLVMVAYRAAGISLPRTSFVQATIGVAVPTSALLPGDLLFFRGGDPIQDDEHVGIYVGDGEMIHAPYTGTVVQFAPVPMSSVEVARRVILPQGIAPTGGVPSVPGGAGLHGGGVS